MPTCRMLLPVVVRWARLPHDGSVEAERHLAEIQAGEAINTMRATGRDMLDRYKETSRGGLAVNVIEC